MRPTHLASLSVLATALACGAALWRPQPAGLSSAERAPTQDPERGLRSADGLLRAADDDVNLRVTPVVKAVRRAADSVVSIYVIDRRQNQGNVRADGQGSGVILDANGLVITNWHVVALARSGATPTTCRRG